MNQRVDVRSELATCIKGMGGKVLDELLQAPNFRNADFWFPSYRIVAELKCLEEDLFAKDGFKKKTADLYRQWVKKGLIEKQKPGQNGLINLTLSQLPYECGMEISNLLRSLLRPQIRKANQQIRATRQFLAAPDARGLLVLVNEGNYALTPAMMQHLLARILVREFECIDSVVYLSVNECIQSTIEQMRFWVEWTAPNRSPIAKEFMVLLQQSWIAHHAKLLDAGSNVLVVHGLDIESVDFKRR